MNHQGKQINHDNHHDESKRGLADSVSCPTMEIPGRPIEQNPFDTTAFTLSQITAITFCRTHAQANLISWYCSVTINGQGRTPVYNNAFETSIYVSPNNTKTPPWYSVQVTRLVNQSSQVLCLSDGT